MLDKAKTLKGYALNGLDGDVGNIKDLYFDDRHWAIRYLVAETGTWLTGRQVLISPYAVDAVSKEEHRITIGLTKKQIEDSPSLNTDKPVSQQFEEAYFGYYGWPIYWGGPYMWGSYPYIVRDREQWRGTTPGEKARDPHLRSIADVSGRHIQATDGDIGHVDDFIVDDETWAIRYLVIDTQNWWPGKKVLVSPQWIERVSWREATVFVNLLRETIKQSPPYTEPSLVTRDYETRLYQHYQRQGYWVDEAVPTNSAFPLKTATGPATGTRDDTSPTRAPRGRPNPTEGSPVMQLNLADDDVQVLRDVLTDYLSDLRMEIADTDQMDLREKLKERKRVLETVLGALSLGS